MFENFFFIFLYYVVVDIFNVCNNYDNNVKINDFIDVIYLIQFYLQILNFEKIYRINNDRKYVCELIFDFCIILLIEYEIGLGIYID